MIGGFKDEDARSIFDRRMSRRFGSRSRIILRKLLEIEATTTVDKLRYPPGNRLEVLRGDRAGQYSIRVMINSGSASHGGKVMHTTSKLRTTTSVVLSVGRTKRMPPVHPGEMLREEFLVPLRLSANALALALGVPATRISEIVNERRGITGDTAIRLGEYFRMGPEFWMNLQTHYELEVARDARNAAGGGSIKPAPVDEDGALLARTA